MLKKLPDNVQEIQAFWWLKMKIRISSLKLPENITMDFCEDGLSAHKFQNVIKGSFVKQQIQQIRSERDTH